jgi:hypothetical protein
MVEPTVPEQGLCASAPPHGRKDRTHKVIGRGGVDNMAISVTSRHCLSSAKAFAANAVARSAASRRYCSLASNVSTEAAARAANSADAFALVAAACRRCSASSR